MTDNVHYLGGPPPVEGEGPDPWEAAIQEARAVGARAGVILFLDAVGDEVLRIPVGCGLVLVRALVRDACRELGDEMP